MLKVLILLMAISVSVQIFSMEKSAIVKKIENLEKEYNINKGLLYSIVTIESRFRSNAINEKTEPKSYGLTQLTPDTAIFYCKLKFEDILDPMQNLRCGARVLSAKLKKYNNVNLAIMGYNEGQPCYCDGTRYIRPYRSKTQTCKPMEKAHKNCEKKGEYRETQYLRDVLEIYNKIDV